MISNFRAWDKSRKLMIDDIVVIDMYNEYIGYLYASSIVQGEIVSRLPINKAILMQSTGLKDKNDKEIYEGDICSTDLSRPYLVVVFRNGAFMYQCHDEGRNYFDIMLQTEVVSDVDKYTEVIGNIYENPELLEVEDE